MTLIASGNSLFILWAWSWNHFHSAQQYRLLLQQVLENFSLNVIAPADSLFLAKRALTWYSLPEERYEHLQSLKIYRVPPNANIEVFLSVCFAKLSGIFYISFRSAILAFSLGIDLLQRDERWDKKWAWEIKGDLADVKG